MSTRRAWWTLGGLIVAAGAVLRFWGLGDVGISQWDAGSYLAGPLGLGPYGTYEFLLFYAPPLVPWMHEMLFMLNGGVSDTPAIALHALIGSLTVLATGLVGRRLVGRAAGWVGAAALAGMEYHVIYSRQPLTEAAYTLLFVLAVGAGFVGWRDGHRRDWVICGLWTGTACLVKYHGFFPLIVIAGLVLLGWWQPFRAEERDHEEPAPASPLGANSLRGLLLAGLVAAVPATALLVSIANEVGLSAFSVNREQWLPEPGLYLIPQTARYLLACLTAWVSPIVLLAALGGVIALQLRRTPGGVVVLWWLVLFAGTLPLYKNYPRLPVPMLPALALAAGVGLVALASRLRPGIESSARAVAVLAAFVLAADAVGLHETLSVSDRGYAELAQWLREAETTDGLAGDAPDILVVQHAVLPYLAEDAHPFFCYDDPGAAWALESGDFRHLVFDLRSIHAPEFTAWRDAHADEITLVHRIGNPLPEPFLVNAAGFEALHELQAPDTPEPRLRELTEIRVWRRER